MSTLGKILTVVVVVVAIAVAVLVSREFVKGRDWKMAYEDQVALFDEALEQRDQVISQRNELKNQTDADRAGLVQQINTLENQVTGLARTNAILRKDNENQQARLQELTQGLTDLKTNYEEVVAMMNGYRSERDGAHKAADDLRTMYSELEKKHRVTLDDRQKLTESLRAAREQIADLQGKLAYLVQNGAKLPAEVPQVPSEKLEGLVAEVDTAAGVAQVNLGSDDGVVKGMKFYIYDRARNRYLATLTIDKVSHDSAAGELSIVRGTVGKGNHVTNRFE
ncbi:MAG: hypothetical protein WBC59_02015 [Phycisphaerae bacterium]